MTENTVSQDIYLSRDSIRQQLTTYTKDYLDLQNVDLTQSSFLSYIINVLSTLSSNLLFYQGSVYKEFFLTQAQLPESVYNLSSFIGYTPSDASYASVNVLMTVPLTFTEDTTFTIPEGFSFKTSDGITFQTYYTTNITVTGNSSITAQINHNGLISYIPIEIDTVNQVFYVSLPTRQYKQSIQEFQIDSDLQIYQFTQIKMPLSGKISDIKIYVRDPNANINSSGLLYTRFQSLYLMSSSDLGFVMRKSQDGRTLYFGNGIMGVQPLPGSTVIAHILETEGLLGNVISGSITTGDRIYSTQEGVSTIISYTCTNVSSAINGEDEESIQDVRSNSIANLTSMGRLVTENDFKNIDIVIPNAPFGKSSIPVLKRSDLKINEICLFNTLYYNEKFIPLKNTILSITDPNLKIERNTVIPIDGEDYITLFEIIPQSLNNSAYYNYVIETISLTPILSQTYSNPLQETYQLSITACEITKVNSTIEMVLYYTSVEGDITNIECSMNITDDITTYSMTNNPGTNGGTFTYTFPDYILIAEGEIQAKFNFRNSNLIHQPLIADYILDFIIYKNLRTFMISSMINNIIYDIPVIHKDFYDNLPSQKEFEVEVLQNLLANIDLVNYRMLTDFVNIKFYNTIGKLTNMLLNDTSIDSVLDIWINELPLTGTNGDRYIISANPHVSLAGKEHNIAILKDIGTHLWAFQKPISNDCVFVISKSTKYVFSSHGWCNPVYDIPLKIEAEVVKLTGSIISDITLSENIKNAIYDRYKDSFGANITIYRSEIIEIIQSVTGVSNCCLIYPKTSIFFNYDINDFTQGELLAYTPEMVYFNIEDITIKILAPQFF